MFPRDNGKHRGMLDEAISFFENFLGVEKTAFSFQELWMEDRPEAAGDIPLKDFIGEVIAKNATLATERLSIVSRVCLKATTLACTANTQILLATI